MEELEQTNPEICEDCHGTGMVGDRDCSSCNGRGEL